MRAFEVNNKLLKDKGMELQPFGDNQMQFSNEEFVLTLSEHNFLDIYHKNTGRRRLCDMVFDILTPGTSFLTNAVRRKKHSNMQKPIMNPFTAAIFNIGCIFFGMTISSLFITHTEHWKYYLPICIISFLLSLLNSKLYAK